MHIPSIYITNPQYIFIILLYIIFGFLISLVAQLVKNLPAMQETWVRSLVGKIPWRRERLPTPIFLPREFHGLYSPRGRQESDMTEQLSLYNFISFRGKKWENLNFIDLFLYETLISSFLPVDCSYQLLSFNYFQTSLVPLASFMAIFSSILHFCMHVC